ncbi:MAG: exo-alpha-sialidase [Fimbriimonadaceae bacterium]|nr:exo-alpha-sialidase [Fimbriimonadaceae bacterium]
MKRAWPIFFAIAVVVVAQEPNIGPQYRVSLDVLSKSASETTGAATADGSEILAGFVDFRTDGTITNSFGVSSDGGQTWQHRVVRAPAGFQDSLEADPMTAYDPRTNTLFAGGISRAKCIYVAQKLPGLNAFGPSRVAVTSAWPDKGWMAAGPRPGMPDTTRLYVTYNEGIIWSDDLGVTWSPPLSLGVGYGFLPRVGPDGVLFLTYWDGFWGIKFTKSMDGGQTWTTPIQPATRMVSWGVENYGIPGNFRNVTNNAMAVNPATGEIVILYVDQTNIVNGQKNLDLYSVRSSDAGETWTNSQRLPFRTLNQVSDMIFPWIEFTKDGRLHLFAMDTAPTPGQADGGSEGFWDQTYYYSDDAGISWSAMNRLTPTSWRSSLHNTGNAKFLGDYQGMAISDKTVYPVYPDTIVGKADAYVNPIFNPIERPTTYSWSVGTPLSGSLASLFLHDGNLARAKTPRINSIVKSVQLEAYYAVSASSISSLEVLAWGGASAANLQQRIEMFNTLTQKWDIVDERPATSAPSKTQFSVAVPSAYLSGGLVKARMSYRTAPRTFAQVWVAQIDQFILLVHL